METLFDAIPVSAAGAAAMAVFWIIMYFTFHPISNALSSLYPTLSRQLQVEWCITLLAFVHDIISASV